MGNGKIFIQIASYRDPQLIPTIKDCIKNAKKPEKLVFSIAWQHSDADKWDNLDEFKGDDRFKIVDIPYLESKGACWARNQLQQNYNNEEYTLQLDSHHRFIENWDEEFWSRDNRKCDWDARQKVQERIDNGLRLFGKYYQTLWD